MKTIKFRLIKDKTNLNKPYSIEIKKFGTWVSKKDSYLTVLLNRISTIHRYASKKEAIKSLKDESVYKSKYINYIQYPTIIKY